MASQLAPRKVLQLRLGFIARAAFKIRNGARPEDPPDDRRIEKHRFQLLWQAVHPGSQQSLDGRRDRRFVEGSGLPRQATLTGERGKLLGIQRAARSALEHGCKECLRRAAQGGIRRAP